MDEYIITNQNYVFKMLDLHITDYKINKILGGVTEQSLDQRHKEHISKKDYKDSFNIYFIHTIEITDQFTIKEWKFIINKIIQDQLDVLNEIFDQKCKNKKVNIKLSQTGVQIEPNNIIQFYIAHN